MVDHRIIFIAIALCAIVGLLKLLARGDVRRHQIERKRLLTPTEVRFWRMLVAAVPDHAVFSQVAMGAMLKPVSGLSRSDW